MKRLVSTVGMSREDWLKYRKMGIGGSDAARLLPVEMQKPDGGKLKYFQDNPLIVSTFYYFFIKWYIEKL